MNLINKTIVFQGDSITDMQRARDNFWDKNHLYGHGYVFLLSGYFGCEMAEQNITVYNRGVSGDASAHIAKRWDEDVLQMKPDVVSLLVGINDLILEVSEGKRTSTEEYSKVLTELVKKTKLTYPEIEIILCEPFSFPEAAAPEYRELFRTRMPELQQAVKSISQNENCLFVPLQETFNEAYRSNEKLGYSHWIWDGIHPTAAGHRVLAKQWKKVTLGE